MRSLLALTAMSAAIVAMKARDSDADELGAREQMGDEVPLAVREDAEFQRLFRESQKIKNSRRPADQEALRVMLSKMRVRWGELTGGGDA